MARPEKAGGPDRSVVALILLLLFVVYFLTRFMGAGAGEPSSP